MTAYPFSSRPQRLARSLKPATSARFTPFVTLAALASVAVLSGCSSLGLDKLGSSGLVSSLSPYRMEVVQGNFVSKEQADVLKPGMPRAQVRDILGTPLLTSVFHADRWDYVFTIRRQGMTAQARRLSVFFKGDTLDRFEGDDLPSESEFVGQLESNKKLGKAPSLEANPEALKKFAPTAPAAPTVASPGNAVNAANATAVTTAYPPLEGTTP